MVKFVVVLYRKPGTSRAEFRRYLADVHGPTAETIPGLRRYVQNYVAEDPSRADPGWDAVVELYWRTAARWSDTAGARAQPGGLRRGADDPPDSLHECPASVRTRSRWPLC
jgi:uncharacterized protein (TIGR02118 family)